MDKKPKNFDEYLALWGDEHRRKLVEMRDIIQNTAPEAGEKIAYAIPTFTWHGNLVHFGAFKEHIGFYPTPAGMDEIAQELKVYKQGKGSVQFPLHEPLPKKLIERMVKFRMEKNLERLKKPK